MVRLRELIHALCIQHHAKIIVALCCRWVILAKYLLPHRQRTFQIGLPFSIRPAQIPQESNAVQAEGRVNMILAKQAQSCIERSCEMHVRRGILANHKVQIAEVMRGSCRTIGRVVRQLLPSCERLLIQREGTGIVTLELVL